MALRAFAGGTLFAETFGEGPPRVLGLHGWGRRGADFAASLAAIPAIAPDLPGFGATPRPPSVWGADEYAAAVDPILDEFPRGAVVVGHSFGGRVAVCLAVRRPEKVGRLVLTGAPLVRLNPPRNPPLVYRWVRRLHQLGLISDERMEVEKKRRGSADYRAAEGIMRDILVKVVNESYESRLQALRCPVDLIWGESDREVPLEVGERVYDLITAAGGQVTLQVLPGVGHQVPGQAADDLRRFIEPKVAG